MNTNISIYNLYMIDECVSISDHEIWIGMLVLILVLQLCGRLFVMKRGFIYSIMATWIGLDSKAWKRSMIDTTRALVVRAH